jgi:hypothetical protein
MSYASKEEEKEAFVKNMYEKYNIGEIHQYYEKGNSIMAVLSANFVILFGTLFAFLFMICLVISALNLFDASDATYFMFYSLLLGSMIFASWFYI